jgi:hypothetical protein
MSVKAEKTVDKTNGDMHAADTEKRIRALRKKVYLLFISSLVEIEEKKVENFYFFLETPRVLRSICISGYVCVCLNTLLDT